MSNFAVPYCKRVRYVGILRFHNILSTIMSSLFSWARQPNYLSRALFCCDHYLLNLMGRFWFFSLSQLVLRSYNIVKTESVLKNRKYIQSFVPKFCIEVVLTPLKKYHNEPSSKRSVNFEMSFWCLQLFQKTNKNSSS
jgi:hypothetical protein